MDFGDERLKMNDREQIRESRRKSEVRGYI